MKKGYWYLLVCLFLIGAGAAAGYAAGFNYEHGILVTKLNIIHPIRDRNSNYKFIDPLLAYVIPPADQDPQLSLLQNNIANFINGEKRNNGLADASMYFYDLNRGRWIGVNESQKYNPASMLKVVIMVAYLKNAENNPAVLQKELVYTSDLQTLLKKDQFNSDSSLTVSQSYTVDELINKMIIESDNGAEFLLLNNIDLDSLNYIYRALNITSPQASAGDFVISPRAYSLFFRIIYSATYLSRDMSEKALETLSRATFADGIVAGLPANTVVAHKFGEYVISSNNQIQGMELHDCGIVYYKDNPYFLCVMTKGNNLDELKNVIKNISSMVYQNYVAAN